LEDFIMYIIGLTGGIASGKSTVSNILRQLGAYIIDADKLAREVVLPGEPGWKEVVEYFGHEILLPDKTINRKVLAEKIFSNSAAKKQLEEIIHPRIRAKVEAAMQQAALQGYDIVVLDVPLLLEVGWHDMADEVWVVFIDAETQLSRLMARDGLDRLQAIRRLNSQMALTEKRKFADIIINNNGSVDNTRQQLLAAWHQVLKKVQAGR